VWYGISFILPLIAVIISRLMREDDLPVRVYVVLGLVAIWGLRLAVHIGVRHRGEDFRYADMRKRWTEVGGNCGFIWRTILWIFLMQGLFALVANSAALFTVIFASKGDSVVTYLDIAGIVVWVVGFLIEVISDEHLRQHMADKTPGKEKFIKKGLWRYSRHPNYFGECLLWWGPYLIACSTAWGWASVFAPVFIGLLVRFVSGVPLGTEDKYADNVEWKQYCVETNIFVPMCVRKGTTE